jgi:hypothetical protein
MRSFLVVCLAVVAWSTSAWAMECSGWQRLDDDQKLAAIQQMIGGHLSSNVGRKYTSENTVAMRRCLEGFVERIRDDFDDACSKGMRTGKKALDDIFDRYFLSCVQ